MVQLYLPSMTPRIGAKGQVVIPKEMRESLGLGPGTDVAFEEVQGGVVVRPAASRSALRGRFADSGMASRLLEDRRHERD
jgi:AbrB family looped-hinge helix DNA binding protein